VPVCGLTEPVGSIARLNKARTVWCMTTLKPGQHVEITTKYETLEAVIIEINGGEVTAQELGTRRVEIFGLHMCKPLR
jgi:hypothetical protein